MKISIVLHEHMDCSSWKFRPFNMKIWTVHHENVDHSSWKSGPFIIKISTVHHENLDRSNMKISTVQHENLDRSSWKSCPFNMKISTDHHENLDCSTWKSCPFNMKLVIFLFLCIARTSALLSSNLPRFQGISPCLLAIHIVHSYYNRGQNLWNNVKKLRKIGQDKKFLKSVFALFLTTSTKFFFEEGRLGIRLCLLPW